MSRKKDIPSDVDKRKLMAELGNELFDLIRVARYALDSWPIRMSIEIASGIKEERLEKLGERIEEAIANSKPT